LLNRSLGVDKDFFGSRGGRLLLSPDLPPSDIPFAATATAAAANNQTLKFRLPPPPFLICINGWLFIGWLLLQR
jgi:hypothetical protein